jgi:transposase-like protein
MSDTLNLATLGKHLSDADVAREFLEAMRWPNGPGCPRCGSNEAYRLTVRVESKRPVRKGVLKCKSCRKQFTVTVGTIFEDSHIPLNKWLLAIYLLCSSKKGMSAHQLHRMLDITYKSAWFMAHRIRYAMTQGPLAIKLQGTVEADETYIGGKAKNMHKSVREKRVQGRGVKGKAPVVTLIERDGRVRSQHMEKVTQKNLRAALRECVGADATICTDESAGYFGIGEEFASHEAVNHFAGEYVRRSAHVNSAESFHALLKRGVHGVYHHWSVQHLHRYLSEFDFRFNARKMSDGERAAMTIKGFEGKRLMYRDSSEKVL